LHKGQTKGLNASVFTNSKFFLHLCTRIGKYENSWGLAKTNADTYRRLFPIPTVAFQTNSKLVQNPGY